MAIKPVEKSYDFCQTTIGLVKQMEETFLILGARFKKIRDEQMYLPSYESFYDFLKECRLTESKASKLITVYETYVEEYGFSSEEIVAAGGWTLLYDAKSLIKNKGDAKRVLHDLKHRDERDGRAYLMEARKGVEQEKCKHRDTYTIVCCRECGLKIRDEK